MSGMRIVVCLGLLFLGISLGGAQTAPVWTFVKPGLSWRSWRGPLMESPAVVLRVDLRRWALRSVRAQDLPGSRGGLAPLEDFTKIQGAAAVLNGGFFDVHHQPMGLRADRGQRLQAMVERDWGVFAVTQGGRAGQVHSRDWSWHQDVAFAVQAGPRLVVAGEALSMKPSVARRSVLAMDEQGRVLWIVCPSPTSLGQLASSLATSEKWGGLGVREALALDGGPSTGLWVRGGMPVVAGGSRVGDAVVLVPVDE